VSHRLLDINVNAKTATRETHAKISMNVYPVLVARAMIVPVTIIITQGVTIPRAVINAFGGVMKMIVT